MLFEYIIFSFFDELSPVFLRVDKLAFNGVIILSFSFEFELEFSISFSKGFCFIDNWSFFSELLFIIFLVFCLFIFVKLL